MTQQEHDKLAGYSQKHFLRIFGDNVKFSEKESIEFFYDAYSKKPDDIYKAIVQEIHQHYFRVIGNIQRTCKEVNSYTKKCNRCKKTLDSSEFYRLYDKKYEFHHLASYCKKCCCEMKTEDYRKSESYREKHLKRSKKYRDNNPEKVAETKAWSYKRNKKKYIALAQEKRDLSVKWWETLNEETKSFYLEKYGFKKPNRDAKLKSYRNEFHKSN